MTSASLDMTIRVGLVASACAVSLLVAVPRLVKSYAFAPWAKTAMWSLAAVVALWAPLGFVQIGASPNKAIGLAAISGWTFLSGVIVGIGFTLVISGALKKGPAQRSSESLTSRGTE